MVTIKQVNFQAQGEEEFDVFKNDESSENMQENRCLAIVPVHYHIHIEDRCEPINFIHFGIKFATGNLCANLAKEISYISDNMFGSLEEVEDLDDDTFLAAKGAHYSFL